MKLILTLPHRFFTGAFLLFSSLSTLHAAPENPLIAKGDIADRSFNPGTALESYLPAEKVNPNNVELLLRISRQYRHLMSDTWDNDKKVTYGRLALTYDNRAAKLAPNNSEAQLSVAITYGKMVPLLGKKEQISAANIIKTSADRAIKLNSRNDTAWHVLGRWNQGMANVSGLKRGLGGMLYGKLPPGSYEESVKCFDKAIAIDSTRLRNYIELGISYSLWDQPEKAREYLKKGLAMPNKEKDDPSLKLTGKAELAKLE